MRRTKRTLRRRFVLTPLVDVIFLLVIFFALTSRIAPFGLIPVSAGSEASSEQDADASSRLPTEAESTLVLSRGVVRSGSRIIALGELSSVAAEWRRGGTQSVLVVTARTALGEDVARALDGLRRGGVANVRIIARSDGGATTSRREAMP